MLLRETIKVLFDLLQLTYTTFEPKNMTLRHLNFLLSFALVLAMTTSTQAQRLVSLDFGSSFPSRLYSGQAAAPDVAGGGIWNGTFFTTASGLVDSTNVATAVGINITINFGFVFDSSNTRFADQELNGGFSNLFRDYAFSTGSMIEGEHEDLVPGVIFGLVAGNAYDLYFYGQGDNFTDTNISGGQNVGIRIGTDVRHTGHDGVLGDSGFFGGNRVGGDGLLVEDIEYVVFRGIIADSQGEINFEQFNPGAGSHATDSTFFDSSLLAAGDPLAVDADGNDSRFHAVNGIQIVGEFPPFVLGDANLDIEVTFADIPPFIALLIADSFLAQADCNQDGVVDFADIPAFIAILVGS